MMRKIINLTQHAATAEQIAQGVVEPADKAAVQALLTFDEMPNKAEYVKRAEALASLAEGYDTAMIGGAPYFMSTLESVLENHGIHPVYSWSPRKSVDVPQADGSVRKIAVFTHLGFIE